MKILKYWVALSLLLILAACSDDKSTDSIIVDQKLTSPSDTAKKSFGRAVYISKDGSMLLTGDNHATYLFALSAKTLTWVQQDKLNATGEISLSTDGRTALIGNTVFLRAAYGTWTKQATLAPADIIDDSRFHIGTASCLSADGNTALIGVIRDVNYGPSTDSSVYVFIRSPDGNWTQQAELIAEDTDINDGFGGSLALSADGNTALIGAKKAQGNDIVPGAAYVFSRNTDNSWIQQAKLTAMDRKRKQHKFGKTVSLAGDGTIALIGAQGYDGGAEVAFMSPEDIDFELDGSVYVFARTADGKWSQQDVLYDTNERFGFPLFGDAIILSEDGRTALIGDPGSIFHEGSVSLFIRNTDNSWSCQTVLSSGVIANQEEFGSSISFSQQNDIALIGTPGRISHPGVAYVFTGFAQPNSTP